MELNEQEKQILEVFMADKPMYEAVQKIARERIEKERDMFIRNKALRKGKSPQDVGTQVQIFDEAILLVDAIFADLRQFRKFTHEPTQNPGR